jgi:hypothetical protein
MSNASHYVGATFDDGSEAAAAVAELHATGGDRRGGILVRGVGGHDDIGHQVDRRWGQAVARGIGLGIPLGMLAGMLMVWVAMPATGLSLGATLVGGAAAGISLGCFFGGVFGIALDGTLAEQEAWDDLEVEPGQVLVAAPVRAVSGSASSILEQHGGRLVQLA